MRFQTKPTGFWLPFAGALAIAIPAFVLGHRQSDFAATPPPARHPAIELSCGPFVDSFAAMRAEEDRIATLAASTVTSIDEESPAPAASVEIWREVAAAAQSLDKWAWEAQSQRAPLTLHEAAVVSATVPLTAQIRSDSTALAQALTAPAGEVNSAALPLRMEDVARNATAVARALEPLAICDSPNVEVTYAPPSADCQKLDSKKPSGRSAPCGY